MAVTPYSETLSPAQVAWTRFVDKVKRGEAIDLSGQYVADGTKAAVDAAGNRTIRPKFDAATPEFSKHYRYLASTQTRGTNTGVVVSIDCAGDPNNPSQECNETGGGNSGGIYSAFTSSEGRAPYSGADNPNGHVWDVKLGYGSQAGGRYGIPNSYTIIPTNLNEGAGGNYIYIGFSRVPQDVSESPEQINHWPYSTGPVVQLAYIAKYSFRGRYPIYPSDHFPIWVDTGVRNSFEVRDLNQGAGGTYIRGAQTKSPRISPYVPVEVGVLSGNSASIQPPAGWTKVSIDLNEGAGGSFIYFCTKPR